MKSEATPGRPLADQLEAAKLSWLPIAGHVVNFTFTLEGRDEAVKALRLAGKLEEKGMREPIAKAYYIQRIYDKNTGAHIVSFKRRDRALSPLHHDRAKAMSPDICTEGQDKLCWFVYACCAVAFVWWWLS